MPELVTGATGYVGGRLIERLLAQGRPVRALARNPSRLDAGPEVEAVQGDLVTGEGLERALDGCTVAYYLVHSMEPAAGAGGGFAARDRIAADNFARAAEKAGVEQIVYLGGIVPADAGGEPSPHLASRLEVEEILLEASPRSTALRASILVGARSSSFRILVRLVERLRVLPFPAWRDHRTQPIDERDAIEYLARTPFTPAAEGRSLDIAGPDLMSYGEMIERIADLMGVGRTPLRLRASATPLASAVVSAIVEQPLELVRPLMYSLERDLLPRSDEARELYGFRIHSFDRAVEHALADWEMREPLGAR
jgi:uncharacterized protein YbjT (DUF2867 family)